MKFKSIIFGLLVTTASAPVFAQKSAVSSAKADYEKYELLKGTPSMGDPVIKSAKASIDKAVLNEKTSSDPQAWAYRALIYASLATSAKEGEAAPLFTEAMNSLKKAKELDQAGTQKANLNNANTLIYNYQIQKGKILYDNKDYTNAYNEFVKSLEIMPGDTTATYVAGVSAMYAKDYKNSLAKFTELTKTNYSSLPEVYANMAYMHILQKDTAAAIKVLSEGSAKFPDNKDLATREIEYSLMSGKNKEVISKVAAQAAKNPTNKLFPYYLGLAYMNTNDNAKAEEAFTKALAIDPGYSDAVVNMSSIIMNNGIAMYNKSNKLPTSKAAEAAATKKKAMAEFNRALPYLQKAVELNPKSVAALTNLKQYYDINNNTAKVTEIDAKIKALK
jgi:tetratricopeptide (TPR) repeat protein